MLLIFLSILDYKKDKIPNKSIIIGFILKILEIIVDESYNQILKRNLLQIMFIFIFYFILWLKNYIGGGDLKLFLMVSLFLVGNYENGAISQLFLYIKSDLMQFICFLTYFLLIFKLNQIFLKVPGFNEYSIQEIPLAPYVLSSFLFTLIV